MNFLFANSVDSELTNRVEALYDQRASHKLEKYQKSSKLLIYSNHPIQKYNLINSLNQVEDISLEEASFFRDDHDSITARMFCDDSEAIFITDHWGMLPFYYYQGDGTFLISNNIFLIQNVLNAEIAQESIFEALLLKKPIRSRTWFAGIKCSLPCQSIHVNLQDGKVKLSEGEYGKGLFGQPRTDYVQAMEDFFCRAFRIIEKQGLTSAASLSSGSDSRTVLAGLMAHSNDFRVYSWGGENYAETKRISNLAQEFGMNWKLIDFDQFSQNERENVALAQLSSNGLSPSSHYTYFYGKIPPGSALFEGVGGSELFKVELSYGKWTFPYKNVITTGANLRECLVDYFSVLTDNTRNRLIDFIETSYRDYFTPVNTPRGYEVHKRYLLELAPARIFNGILNSGLHQGHRLYEPFFSRNVLSAYFSHDLGLQRGTSLSNNFPGGYKAIRAQAEMVKRLYPPLLKPQFDRGYSMQEAFLPELVTVGLRKARSAVKKIRENKALFRDQVDYNMTMPMDQRQTLHPKIVNMVTDEGALKNLSIFYVNASLNGLAYVKASDVLTLLDNKNSKP